MASKFLQTKKARELCELAEKSTLNVGDKWCLISHKWWLEFMDKKDNAGSSDYIELPPISNEQLLEKSGQRFELKPKLMENFDFTPVPEPVFDELRNAFGVENESRDIIQRKVVKGTILNNQIFIEYYPLEFKIARFSDRDKIVTLKVSKAESVDEIQTKAMDALNIPENQRRNAQFLVEENNKYEYLPNTISESKLNELIGSAAVIYIDETGKGLQLEATKSENGTPNGSRQRYSYSATILGTREKSTSPACVDFRILETRGKYHMELNEKNPLGTGGKLVGAYAELIKDMWSGQMSSVRPSKLKGVIGQFAPRFNGYAQQDSQELTSFLLDGIHEDLNRIKDKPYIEEKEGGGRPDTEVAEEAWKNYMKRNDSIIVDLLHGQLKSTLVCPECHLVSVKFDPFCFLSVPVPAKERAIKSVIVFVRSGKWAKFVISHTTKTTARAVIDAIKENLQMPAESKVALISSQSAEMVDENNVLAPSSYSGYGSYSSTKHFYAFSVEGDSYIIVENKTLQAERSYMPLEKTLGVPLVLHGKAKTLTCQYVYDAILPTAKTQNVPAEIHVMQNGKSLMLSDEEKEVPLVQGSHIRVILKWRDSSRFSQVNTSTLVDRELNLTSTIKKSHTLNDCLNAFTSEEQLDENDTWYCPKCKEHQRAYKKLDLWSLPDILIVHLKRFQYTRYSREKIDSEIVIPTRNLDMTDKVANPDHGSLKYKLIAVSNHIGSLGSGHYTAKAWNASLSRWCEFNDSSAYNMGQDMPEQLTSREAYILFYRREEPNAGPNMELD
ncbi:ubiquitin carboxyl-terminal hydrolase domain-containing protein [Ditylenchus destructor]|uniref:ubiquitinyl hydrolase 1 n=1 Tax=Ditylenchus destructor TaxID=166010 RepID=A0AAD4R7H9_9BILA|nr:ubiquitin carboxyl-terminal hydrolase domain-containing protein [Ditylenchus destructor]